MKTILTILITALTFSFYSQVAVWTTVSNLTELEKNEEFQTLKSTLNLTITKAFPSSRNSQLQKVYEISTINCNQSELYFSLSKIENLSNIEYAPEYQSLSTPNDYTTSFPNNWALNLIEAQSAWNYSKGSPDIQIAISDANFYINHEELINKYTHYTTSNTGTNYAHGTAVSIIAAGNTNNSIGTSSIGYNSSLQLRAMNYNEILNATYSGAKVINLSWASSCYYNGYSQQVIDEAYSNGSVIIASAGNGSTCGGSSNLVYPASYNHVISVTSIGPGDNHERFIGDPNSTHQHNSLVDICAPGYDVPLSTAPGVYTTGNGTSFAAPFVSGTVALMLSANPCLTVDQIEYILKQTADSTIYNHNSSYQGLLGSGRLNSHLAVKMASEYNTMNANLKTTVDCLSNIKSVRVTNLTGISPYTFEWSTNENLDYVDINESKIYSVKVIDSLGCIFTDSIYSEVYSPISTSLEIITPRCFGHNDASISIEVIGGEETQLPIWQNGYQGRNLTNISKGTYTYTITDAFDCTLIDTVEVLQPEKLESTITTQNLTTGTLGEIDVTVTGGTTPYTYEWNTGQSTEDLQNLNEGFYELLITDSNGCMVSVNSTLELENTASINNLQSSEFEIFPNPSNGNFTIHTSQIEKSNMTLIDYNGKVIHHEEFHNQINLNNLTAGIYMINVNGKTQKIIIQ